MQNISENNYKDFCSACDRVLLDSDSTIERVAIPWLNVQREHPAFIKNYEGFLFKSSGNDRLRNKFYKRIKWLAENLITIWRSLFNKKQLWLGNFNENKRLDYIFVSHLLSISQLSDDDFYFGCVPNVLRGDGAEVLIVLINHTKNSNEDIENLIKNNEMPRVVIQKVLPPKFEFNIFLRLLKESAALRFKAKNTNDNFEKRVLLRASKEVLETNCKTSIRIALVVEEIVKRTKAKVLITTFEGHSWERVLYASARNSFQRILCIGYLHAALFRLQHSAKRSLGNKYDPDFLVTAGSAGMRQLKESSDFKDRIVGILGSNRYIKLIERQESRTCLVIPEGIDDECIVLFEFSLKCAIRYPDINFIWRVHPIIEISQLLRKFKFGKNLPSNIHLSNSKLEDDISLSQWALYRGTTAVINAAASGVIPIYLHRIGELKIDPLYELADDGRSVSNINEFINAVTSLKVERKTVEYCKEYYTVFDKSVIDINELIMGV